MEDIEPAHDQEGEAPAHDTEEEAPEHDTEEDEPEQEQGPPVLIPRVVYLLAVKRVIKFPILHVLTAVLLCSILLAELTLDYTVWMKKIGQMDGDDWRAAIFVGIGALTSLNLMYSPIDTIFDVLIEGSIGQRLQEPYVAALSNCFVWSVYGLYGGKTVSYPVFIVNAAGVLLYSAYTCVLVCYGNNPCLGYLRVVAGGIVTLMITGAFAIGGCWLDISYGCNMAGIIGWSGAFLSFAMYFVPAMQNCRNIQEMPLKIVMASTLNAAVWTVYGILIGDKRMSIPNILGVVLCIAQLLMYLCSKPHVQDPQREFPEQQGLLDTE